MLLTQITTTHATITPIDQDDPILQRPNTKYTPTHYHYYRASAIEGYTNQPTIIYNLRHGCASYTYYTHHNTLYKLLTQKDLNYKQRGEPLTRKRHGHRTSFLAPYHGPHPTTYPIAMDHIGLSTYTHTPLQQAIIQQLHTELLHPNLTIHNHKTTLTIYTNPTNPYILYFDHQHNLTLIQAFSQHFIKPVIQLDLANPNLGQSIQTLCLKQLCPPSSN